MKWAATILIVCVLAGCVHRPPEPRYRPFPRQVPRSPYGAWTWVHPWEGERLGGELLAVHDDAIYLLRDGELRCVSAGEIREATVFVYEGQPYLTAVHFVGVAATPFMHGFFLLFSAPAWLAGGIVSSSQTVSGKRFFSPRGGFATWARYPGGLPDALESAAQQACTHGVPVTLTAAE